MFPNESRSTYYIPYYVPKRETGTSKGILAKGRLVDKVRNILDQCGETVKYKSKRKLNDIILLQDQPSTSSAGVESEGNCLN